MKKHSKFSLVSFHVSLFVISCFVFVGQGFAAPVLDQSCDISGAGLNSFWTWQQEVTVGVNGELVGISLYFYPNSNGSGGGIIIDLYKGSGWQTGASDYSAPVLSPTSEGWSYIDVSGSNLTFNIGDRFVIGTKWDTSQYPPMLGANNSNAYPGGQLYESGTTWTNWDLAFQTYIEPAPVPIPGDFDRDGDVDGSDLVDLILGNETLSIAAFALDFGRGN
jgi:hypothetical protein